MLCGNLKNNEIGSLGNYSILECSECLLQFLEPIPVQKSLTEIYSDYYKAWDYVGSGNEVSRMKKVTFQKYLKQITSYIPSGTLLDVGCATGELMLAAQEFGFDVYGVEISPYGIRKCKKMFGENKIVATNLKADDFPREFFDLITLSDVIEHITEPVLFVDLLWSLLKADGFLMIATPDTSSWIRKIMGKRWHHYKEEHIYYYNHSNIVKLLSTHFNIIILNNAHKTLTIDYCSNILKAYSDSNIFIKMLSLIRFLPLKIRVQPFEISIGEMFILCRKKI